MAAAEIEREPAAWSMRSYDGGRSECAAAARSGEAPSERGRDSADGKWPKDRVKSSQ